MQKFQTGNKQYNRNLLKPFTGGGDWGENTYFYQIH